MQTGTWLVSRELTERAGPWSTEMLSDDDGEYFSRVLLASEGVKFVPEARVYYRASGSASLSHIGRSSRKVDAMWNSMKLHIDRLRSLEDSERVRAASVIYLQNWLLTFFPERLDIVGEAEELARELGGELQMPALSWKYAWIQRMFGWHAAKSAALYLPQLRWYLARCLDNARSRIAS
jgi:hypothetical protein